MPVFAFLRRQFGNVALNEIESIFGFVECSTLYGGRPYRAAELSERDVVQLNNAGIGLRIPLSNHYVSADEYEQNRPLLEKYHRAGNSIIITNDELARWVRRDFPRYRLDASVIKNIHSQNRINEALELYDSVVLPMRLNTELDFLSTISAKERIILFANAGCALTCPSHLCYVSFSEFNKFTGAATRCSRRLKERDEFGMVDFALRPLMELGFRQFKLLRAAPGGRTGF